MSRSAKDDKEVVDQGSSNMEHCIEKCCQYMMRVEKNKGLFFFYGRARRFEGNRGGSQEQGFATAKNKKLPRRTKERTKGKRVKRGAG